MNSGTTGFAQDPFIKKKKSNLYFILPLLQFVHLDEDGYCVCRHSKCVSDHRKHVLFLAMSGLSHIKAQAGETA